MTTTITVKTHSWPVEVTRTEHAAPGFEDRHFVSQVEPHSEQEIYIHSSLSVSLKELPEPAKAAEPAAEAPAEPASA